VGHDYLSDSEETTVSLASSVPTLGDAGTPGNIGVMKKKKKEVRELNPRRDEKKSRDGEAAKGSKD
jgi:hypothetical protein